MFSHIHNGSPTAASNSRKIITSVYPGYQSSALTNQDTTDIIVFSLTGLTTAAGSMGTLTEQAVHRVGSKNLVGFQAPLLNFVSIEGDTYYYFPYYELPFWQDPLSAGQSTPNNKGVIQLFNITNSEEYKHIELPMPNWSNGMQLSFGMEFVEYQFTSGVFSNDGSLNLMYGIREYDPSCDCFTTSYSVANEEGSVLKSTPVSVSEAGGVTKLAEVQGQNPLYAMGEATAISIFDPVTWEITVTFSAIHNGERITNAFNRIPYGNDYAYLFTMYDVNTVNGDVVQPVNVYDKNGVFIKTQNFNLGPDGLAFTPQFTDATLNPYLVNCDGKREYIGFARIKSESDATIGVTHIYIYSEDGELLYKVSPNSEGQLASPQGLWSINGGKSFDYFVTSYARSGKTYMYKLPFDTFTEGDGSVENPYLISDAGQLDAIRLNVNVHYKIVNDIDMAPLMNSKYGAKAWEAIPEFRGTLNGQNFTISNFKVNNFTGSNLNMFARLSGSARIENLKIDNAEPSTSSYSSTNRISFLAGEAIGASTIRNVHVTNSTVTLNSTVTNSYVGAIVGGVMGEMITVDQCSFNGTIQTAEGINLTSGMIGSIVGDMRATATISNCLSRGIMNVNMSGSTMMCGVGGIAGTLRGNSTIKNCYSNTNITSLNSAGGIVGNFNEQAGPKGLIENCYATGRIISKNANAFAGGLVGYSSTNNAHVQVDYNTYELSLNKTKLNMGSLVALNDTVTGVKANRVSATNPDAAGNISVLGVPTADSLRHIYSIESLKVGAVGTETVRPSDDAQSFDGADKTQIDITESFFTSIGWIFGTDCEHPWVWMEGAYPKLWFEVAVQSVIISEDALTTYIDDTHQLTATVNPEAAINKNVSWTSDNEAVALVNHETGLATATLTAEANTGYNFANWTENGAEVNTAAEFSFVVENNRTLTANFVLQKFEVSYNMPANGILQVTSDGAMVTPGSMVNYGTILSITVTPSTGYELGALTVNGNNVESGASYMVISATTIECSFAPKQFAVNFNDPANGTITVTANSQTIESGSMVNYNTNLVITATPDEGYKPESLTVNGTDFTSGDTHTVTGNVNIECAFTDDVGIDETGIVGIKVYSNANNVYIANPNNVVLQSIQITDITGRTVYQSAQPDAIISVYNAGGVYMMRLIAQDGRVQTTKVILND